MIKGKFGYFCSAKKEKGKTTVIKGFKAKSGKEFDAALKLDKTTGKIEFEFPKKKK